MAQLRHALVGLAMTGESPDRLLTWLNDLVLHRLVETTATAVVGHLDPITGVFTWGQAGHPAPILVRDGVAIQLDPPNGVLLGATLDEPYDLAGVALREGICCCCSPTGWSSGAPATSTRASRWPWRRRRCSGGSGRRPGPSHRADRGPNPEDDTCVLAIGVLG
ncbi:PP2C family protein-serine/threonine phosphatase [Streptosporangium lutulentum]